MRFKAAYSESNTKCCGLQDYFTILLSGNPCTILHVAQKPYWVELQKPNTYVNHGFDETRTQNLLITSGENDSLSK